MRNPRHAPAAALVLLAALTACTPMATTIPRAHEWREGTVIHYTDGYDYQVYVDTALPHYHVSFGKYYEVAEESATHYHVAHNPRGVPEYVTCFATQQPDGTWLHKPQWHELDPRSRFHRMDYSR